MKYWITVHNGSLEISSRDPHISIFFSTLKENEFKHAVVDISAITRLSLELHTFNTVFQKEMSFEKEWSS